MDKKKVKAQIKADANPEKLIDAVNRRDKSYLRGALQWYERQAGRSDLVEFLRDCYSSC